MIERLFKECQMDKYMDYQCKETKEKLFQPLNQESVFTVYEKNKYLSDKYHKFLMNENKI